MGADETVRRRKKLWVYYEVHELGHGSPALTTYTLWRGTSERAGRKALKAQHRKYCLSNHRLVRIEELEHRP